MAKTANMLQSEIEALKEKQRIVNKRAADDCRELTALERELLRDIDNHVADIQNQINALPERSLTMQGPGRSNSPARGSVFSNFGEQLVAIKNAGIPSGRIFPFGLGIYFLSTSLARYHPPRTASTSPSTFSRRFSSYARAS